MTKRLDSFHFKTPRFLLLYSPLQFGPEEMAKPDGSLSLPYLAGSLRRAGYDVKILDVSVGDKGDPIQDSFFNTTKLPSGLIRCGMTWPDIAKKIADFDVIGISSIFTTQTTMVLDLIKFVKQCDPNKLVITGGVNSRNLRSRFYAAGADLIATSEAERTVVSIGEAVRGKGLLSEVPGIAYLNDDGKEVMVPALPPVMDLDELPFPAWDLLPLDKYWDLSRPHGGQFPEGARITYASLQTSRGCPFQCKYCHISKEEAGDLAGALGTFRTKSVGRVLEELEILKSLGARYIFFEDDSLFAKKPRAYELFRKVTDMGLDLSDVNGINIVHLLKNFNGRLDIDTEFLEVLSGAGFHMLHLPFESANQRLIDKYSSGKWNRDRLDSAKLIRECGKIGIKTAGNYMIGYPDETLGEIHNTILFAKSHVEEGMNHAALFAVVPFPGTQIYDMVVESGQLDPNFDTDHMKWTKSILKGLAVPADTLEHLRQLAWLTVNPTEFVNYKINMRVKKPEAEKPVAPAVAPTQLAIL
ncbi:MAG: radical SAM protein [Bryobacterales bacterium]|nr:radical SAM protein [Bryobacterales bacterium]